MKKMFALLLVLAMLAAALAGCAGNPAAKQPAGGVHSETQSGAAVSQGEDAPQELQPMTSGSLLARERDVTNEVSVWHAYDLFGRVLFTLQEGPYGSSSEVNSRIAELYEYQNGCRIGYTFLYPSGDVSVVQRTYDEQDRLLSQNQYSGLLQTDGYVFTKDSANSYTYTYSDDGLERRPDHGENLARLNAAGKLEYEEIHVGETTYVTEYEYDEHGSVCKLKREVSGPFASTATYTYENEYENGRLQTVVMTADDGSSTEEKFEYYDVEDGYEDVYTGMWTEENGDKFLMISLVNGLYCAGYRHEDGFLCVSGYGEYYNRDGETAELSCDYILGENGLEEFDGDNTPIAMQGDKLVVDGTIYVKQN